MSLNIENTSIAFRAKSNGQLLRSYWLYRVLNSPFLAAMGQTMVKVALKLHFPIEGMVRATVFQQFCGGETIGQCLGTIESLARFNIGTVLDYSVEGGQKEGDFDQTQQEILRTVERAKGNSSIPFCVFKISGIAPSSVLKKKNAGEKLDPQEDQKWERAKERLLSISQRAFELNVRIFIDAEESWIQNSIDELTETMMAKFNRERACVYGTLQMYRRDRMEYFRKLTERAKMGGFFVGEKLVRGAYMEKERAFANSRGVASIVFDEKSGTDKNYDEALVYAMEHLDRVAICAGTHNENSTKLLADFMVRKGVERSDERIYFCQLLGMGDHLTYNLANEGFNVAKYVPYGPVRSVMPYLFRRAAENTSVRGQTSRELGLIVSELRHRKKSGRPVPLQN
jgi:proline dehydrogenase